MKSFQAQTHYEVLEISVGATLGEIKSAFERLTLLYADDQVVLYGLIDPARASALRVRLKEAFEVLTDDARRETYDLKIGLPPRTVIIPAPPRPAAIGPTVSAGTGWGGAFAWVTPSAYTYAVTPPKPAAPAAPVMVVPVPARILAIAPAPVQIAPSAPAVVVAAPVLAAAPDVPSEPRQLALDVPAGVPSWGAKPVEPEPAPQPAAAQAPVVEPPVEPVPVAEAGPGEPEKTPTLPAPPAPMAPIEEAPVPTLPDDAAVSIVPARATPSREFRVEQKPRPSEIPEGVEINGDLLKQVRLAKGLSLVQVADRTRIGVKHLENVEGDRYDALPAPVYLRGILMNLARELGLDGLRVSRSYLTFVEAHRSKG